MKANKSKREVKNNETSGATEDSKEMQKEVDSVMPFERKSKQSWMKDEDELRADMKAAMVDKVTKQNNNQWQLALMDHGKSMKKAGLEVQLSCLSQHSMNGLLEFPVQSWMRITTALSSLSLVNMAMVLIMQTTVGNKLILGKTN